LTALMLSGDGNTGSLIRTRCAPNGAMSQYTFVGIKCERNPSHPTAHDPAIYLDNMVAPVTIIGVTMDGSGATTAAAIRRENPTRDTKHFVVIVGSPTGGTWTLNGSAAIAYNATAAQVQTALEGVHGAGNVSVIGGTGPDTSWQVEYIGALANTHVSNPTTTSSLTGGNAPTVFARRMQYGNNGGTPNGIVEVRGGRTLGYTAQFDDLVDPANTISLGSGSVTFSKPAYPHDVTLEFVIDGGGSAITTGVKGDLILPPWAGVITGVQLLADQSGSIVVDLWKDDYAHYPPTVADTITASAKPTLSSATKYTDSALTGWTTAFSAGDTLRLNVDSASTLTRCLVALTVRRPVV
jgi:hypothetical protein